MLSLGFDTSNYTTSCAFFDGAGGQNFSRLLDVPEGALGLRQSDALFSHVKRLPELSDRLFACLEGKKPDCIGVSTRPRAVEGSYMPCFLAGHSQAQVLGAALGIPVVEVSHQQGHIAAALWSTGRLELLEQPFLAWHLSGGTTELLYVAPEGRNVACTKLGGTTDISAGQLIDRTGKLLSLPFPAGKALDRLAQTAEETDFFRVRVNECEFSLSGVQNQVEKYRQTHENPADTAAFALRSVVHAVKQATKNAQKRYPGLPVLCSGGVASNSLLRSRMRDLGAIFAAPEFSTDNAMGCAILAQRLADASGQLKVESER